MSRKNNAILAIGALAAFGFASSAFAQCPDSPTPPWSGVTQTQGAVAISEGGYDGTSCKLDTSYNAGASSFGAAAVRDDTPANEARYRAQFLINASDVVNQQGFASTQIFSATSADLNANTRSIVRLALSGGNPKSLSIIAANEGAPNNVTTTTLPLTGGDGDTHRIEIDLTLGEAGSLSVWVNNTNEGDADVTLSDLDNDGWVGVDSAFLGLAAGNNLFRQNHAGQVVSFDEFDSRRQSFIGE